jgi:hypothetical protein
VTVTKWGDTTETTTGMRLGEDDGYRLVVFLVGVIVGLVVARVFDYLIYVTGLR